MNNIKRAVVCGIDAKNSLNFECLKSAFKKLNIKVSLHYFNIYQRFFVNIVNQIKVKDSTLLVFEPEFHECIVPALDYSNSNIKNSEYAIPHIFLMVRFM